MRNDAGILRQSFGNCLITRSAETVRSSRSLDLSAAVSFLLGYLKSYVYVDKPTDLADLKSAIHDETTVIPWSILIKVFENFVKRIQECIKQKDCLLEDIFKKLMKTSMFIF